MFKMEFAWYNNHQIKTRCFLKDNKIVCPQQHNTLWKKVLGTQSHVY